MKCLILACVAIGALAQHTNASKMRRVHLGTPEYASALDTLLKGMRFKFTPEQICQMLAERVPNHDAAVDWGSGTGERTKFLVPKFARVYAVEKHKTMRDQTASNAPSAMVLDGDIHSIDLPETVDLGLLSHVLYHVPQEEWGQLVMRLATSLTATGALAIVLKHPHAGSHDMIADFGGSRLSLFRLLDDFGDQTNFTIEFIVHPARIEFTSFEDTLAVAQFEMSDASPESFSHYPSEEEFQTYVADHFWDQASGTGGWNLDELIAVVRRNPFGLTELAADPACDGDQTCEEPLSKKVSLPTLPQQRMWQTYWGWFDMLVGNDYYETLAAAIAGTHPPENYSLLDIGSGEGAVYMGWQALPIASKPAKMVAVEPNPDSAKNLSKTLSRLGPPDTMVHSVGFDHNYQLPTSHASDRFDLIVSSHSSYWYGSPNSFRRMRELLAPGGSMVIAMQDDSSPFLMLNQRFGHYGKFAAEAQDAHQYSYEKLRRDLTAAGLTGPEYVIQEFRYFDHQNFTQVFERDITRAYEYASFVLGFEVADLPAKVLEDVMRTIEGLCIKQGESRFLKQLNVIMTITARGGLM